MVSPGLGREPEARQHFGGGGEEITGRGVCRGTGVFIYTEPTTQTRAVVTRVAIRIPIRAADSIKHELRRTPGLTDRQTLYTTWTSVVTIDSESGAENSGPSGPLAGRAPSSEQRADQRRLQCTSCRSGHKQADRDKNSVSLLSFCFRTSVFVDVIRLFVAVAANAREMYA